MPYSKKAELPDGVKNSLPSRAQEIYKEAFNSAWSEHSDKENNERESTAHKIAWSAVKSKFERGGSGQWHKR